MILLAGLALGSLVIFFWPPATVGGGLNITLLSVTNDAAGKGFAVFSATNGTNRLFVRGRSQVEVQGTISNEVTLVQITNVDYLKPGQSIVFSVGCPAPGRPWRLSFYYLGQRSTLENLREQIAWFLYRRGVPVSEKQLRLTPVRDFTTGWIND